MQMAGSRSDMSRRKVAPPSWMIAMPAYIVRPVAALPDVRAVDDEWLPSRSFGGSTGWP
jgi:hypothetical protein